MADSNTTTTTTSKQAPPVSFRDRAVETELETRADGRLSPGRVAARDLARYYYLLHRAVPSFSEPEASLIVDAMNGLMTEPHTAGLLWANIADAVRDDSLDEKWDVDAPALVARLRALTPFEQLAVADASERFWQRPELSTSENLRRVGLVR